MTRRLLRGLLATAAVFIGAAASAAPGSFGAPAASAPASGSPGGNVIQEAALNVAFVNKELTAPAERQLRPSFPASNGRER